MLVHKSLKHCNDSTVARGERLAKRSPATTATGTSNDSSDRPQRRELILDAAITLFREHGFDATGIDEIGAAAGITGPGVYRHFASKQDILDEAVRTGTKKVLQTEREILRRTTSPDEMVDLLVTEVVEQVLDRPALVTVLLRERRNLSAGGRRSWNKALRAYVHEWVRPLRALQPGLSEREAETTVFAAMGIVTAIAQNDGGLDRSTLAARLRGMLRAAVLAQPR